MVRKREELQDLILLNDFRPCSTRSTILAGNLERGMHYRQRSVLFAAPGLIIGGAALGASGGITVADFDKPELLIAALFVGLIIGMAVEQLLAMTRKRTWRRRNR